MNFLGISQLCFAGNLYNCSASSIRDNCLSCTEFRQEFNQCAWCINGSSCLDISQCPGESNTSGEDCEAPTIDSVLFVIIAETQTLKCQLKLFQSTLLILKFVLKTHFSSLLFGNTSLIAISKGKSKLRSSTFSYSAKAL